MSLYKTSGSYLWKYLIHRTTIRFMAKLLWSRDRKCVVNKLNQLELYIFWQLFLVACSKSATSSDLNKFEAWRLRTADVCRFISILLRVSRMESPAVLNGEERIKRMNIEKILSSPLSFVYLKLRKLHTRPLDPARNVRPGLSVVAISAKQSLTGRDLLQIPLILLMKTRTYH